MRQVIAPHVRLNTAESVDKLHNQQVSTLTAADDLARPYPGDRERLRMQWRRYSVPICSHTGTIISLLLQNPVGQFVCFQAPSLPPGAKRSVQEEAAAVATYRGPEKAEREPQTSKHPTSTAPLVVDGTEP